MTATHTKYIPLEATALMLVAYFAGNADGQTHARTIFFALERLLLPALALVIVTAFAVAFHAKQERQKHRTLFLFTIPSVALASAVLAYCGYIICRLAL